MRGTIAPNGFSHGLSSANGADDYYKTKLANTKAKVASTKDKGKPSRMSKPKSGNSDFRVLPPTRLSPSPPSLSFELDEPGLIASPTAVQSIAPPFTVELDDTGVSIGLNGVGQQPPRNDVEACFESTKPIEICDPALKPMILEGCAEMHARTSPEVVVLPCWLGGLGVPERPGKQGCNTKFEFCEEATANAASQGPPCCPQGNCGMSWTRHAKYLVYFCSGCRRDLQGARWHCAEHKEDYCSRCKAPPPSAAFSGGSCDIDDDGAVKSCRPLAKSRARDSLGEMLAAQEVLIQQRRLDRLTDVEAAESRRAAPSSRPPRTASAAWDSKSTAQDMHTQLDLSLMDENAAREQPSSCAALRLVRATSESFAPLERTVDLTAVLAGDFLDELARGYAQPWFQELVQQCARECSGDRLAFLARLQDVAFAVQRPILENWGFEGDEQGVFDLTSIMRQYDHDAPAWLRTKRDRCLELLFGAWVG